MAPIYLNYCKKKPDTNISSHLALVSGMLLGSLGSSLLFHRIAGRYVLSMKRFPPSVPSLPIDKERIRIETISFLGRIKSADLFVQDIQAVNDGITTWKARISGLRFFLSIPSALNKPHLEASTANGQTSTVFPKASGGGIPSESREFLASLDSHLRNQQIFENFKKN